MSKSSYDEESGTYIEHGHTRLAAIHILAQQGTPRRLVQEEGIGDDPQGLARCIQILLQQRARQPQQRRETPRLREAIRSRWYTPNSLQRKEGLCRIYNRNPRDVSSVGSEIHIWK